MVSVLDFYVAPLLWDRGSIPTWFNNFYLSVKFVFIVGICFSISTETFMPVDIRHCRNWNKAS